MSKEKKLPPSHQAMIDRLRREKTVDWLATTRVETRALDALVKKGLVMKVSSHYELAQ